MKTKIFNALKTNYNNLGFGDKAFNGVASFLEKTITDENDIDTVVKGDDVRGLLVGFQGDKDILRTQNTKLLQEYETYKKAHPEEEPKKVEEDESETMQMLRAIKADNDALKARLDASDKAAKQATLLNSVESMLKTKGATNDYIRKNVLKGVVFGEEDTAESLVDGLKARYDVEYSEAFGNGVIPPKGDPQSEGYRSGDFADVKARLQKEGLIPSKETN